MSQPLRGPLIVTAQLPAEVFRWADDLRKAYYPADRNQVDAHVTLFHSLPPSAEGEVRAVLSRSASSNPQPRARMASIMDLGKGTALRIHCPDMEDVWEELAEGFYGLLSAQDQFCPQFHVTLQNKVEKGAAKAFQKALTDSFEPFNFPFKGLQLHEYAGGPWRSLQQWQFRG